MNMDLDRRQFLAGSAGALSMSLIPASLWAAAAKDTVPAAPVARIDVVHDTYFGETLSDPYRWMENSKDPDWLPFLKGQNDHTRAVIRCQGARHCSSASSSSRASRWRHRGCSARAAWCSSSSGRWERIISSCSFGRA